MVGGWVGIGDSGQLSGVPDGLLARKEVQHRKVLAEKLLFPCPRESPSRLKAMVIDLEHGHMEHIQ